ITVGNGSVTRFATASASVYSAEITPAADGTITVDVAAGVAQDAAGNDNTAATQFSIESDSTRPGVEITTASADPVSGVFEVTFTFTEDVTGFVVGDITVGNGSAGNFQSTSASVFTADITPAADGTVTVDVAGGAAADAAGNTNTAATQFSIESDGSAPTVTDLTVSDLDIRVDEVGTPFTIQVTFSEEIDPASPPALSFVESVAGTLEFVSGAFSGSNSVYTATYTVSDSGAAVTGVDVTVAGATDLAGNVMTEVTTEDVFSFDLRRAGITVTQDVLGLVDAEFDYSGDLGAFSITTTSQTGSSQFTDLVEGSYAITLAEEDGFSITDIACTGGSAAIDLPNRTATVTLAPADAVECSFEATADPGIDEINVPDVALTLPDVVGDPTGVTTSFALTNTGGAPFAFNAATDQPWLAIDPTSGSIPAASDLTFTLSFTDAVLALAPGEYTANIIITEAAPAGPVSVGGSSSQSVQNITIPVSITITPREGTLTLVATTAPSIAGEGVFTYSSDIGALDGLSLSTVNGTASSDGVTILSGSYAITQAVSEGWRLDSISCTGDTDNGSTFDVESGTATIDLDAEETMVCTFANRRDEAFIREVTQSAIRSFMAARADQILNASPDVGRRLRSDRATATPNNFAFDMTEGRLNASMTMSLSAIRQAASERENRMPDQQAFSLAGQTGMSSLDVWFEASYASVNDDRAGLDADTDFGMYAIGVDMMVRDDILIGVLAQFDQAETVTGEYRSQVEGEGWLAGPYMAARLSETLVFDARVAWGQSDNEVNPIGTYWDDFETDRWLAEANLVGDIITGSWRFSPGVGIAYFWEEQAQYTDSLGFVIPSQEITLGRITAGPEIAYRFETESGGVFEPFVKFTAVYDYDDTEVISANGLIAGLGTFRADARVGLAAEFANGGRLSAEAAISGIGDGDFEANTGMVRLRLPLSLH
ncbi:Ig-like domain-containing protein, partial [Maricaulaceae bacterium EIL42A08]|nr:Ig-like domain-containing protein [Maricaulaceae bacterium EIL42A08]